MPATKEKFYTTAEVARILRVHRDTVARAMDSGKLPYIVVGKRRHIPSSAVASEAVKPFSVKQAAKRVHYASLTSELARLEVDLAASEDSIAWTTIDGVPRVKV